MTHESKLLLQGLRDLDRDPNRKANNAFIDWLNDNGVWVKQESAWGRAPHPLVISSNYNNLEPATVAVATRTRSTNDANANIYF